MHVFFGVHEFLYNPQISFVRHFPAFSMLSRLYICGTLSAQPLYSLIPFLFKICMCENVYVLRIL